MTSEATATRDRPARAPGPLDNATLWERVHDHLRDEILANRLAPGTELQEVGLSEQLGVSRGPIREAIGRLAAEGLVTVRPRRGAVVTSLSKEEFVEAYQVREALEAFAIRLAVPHLDADGLGELARLADEMDGLAVRGDVDGFFEANARFHLAIVEASGNRQLADMYRKLMGQMGRYRRVSLGLRGSLRRSVDEHRAILRAINRKDSERAAKLLDEHIRVPQRRLEALTSDEFRELERTDT
jgi:DNA-binding GntR family transcriptional regulator